MKIGYLSTDWSFDYTDVEGFPTPGGAGWYRCHLPAKYLERNGVETLVAPVPLVKKSGEICLVGWDDQRHDGFDVIVIQRWMSDEAEKTILNARAAGQIVINDVDDWYGGLSPANAAFESSHPRRGTSMNRAMARRAGLTYTDPFNVNHYAKAIRASSAVTASTPFLAERYGGASGKAIVVRNGIDLERWAQKPRSTTTQPTLGWMGNTTVRSGDLEILRGFLEPFCEQHDLKVVHAGHVEGATPLEDLTGIDPGRVIRAPSVPARLVPTLFSRIDIGLVPLKSVAFNEAKSVINGLSCGASGVPFVASATSEYQIAEKLGLGTTATKPKQWRARLERLLDPGERELEAENNRIAAKGFDMADRWVDWLSAYEAIRD